MKELSKLQASQYLYGKGPGAEVRDRDGMIWQLLPSGDIAREAYTNADGLHKDKEPFSPIEPEKSNEELADKAWELWSENNPLYDVRKNAFKFIFDSVDQKIKGAK